MQAQVPKAKVSASGSKTAKLKIKNVLPDVLPIGVGEIDGIVFADGLFEKDNLGQIVPKKDLMFRVMNQNGDAVDSLILVDPISTDDIFDKYVKVKITVPVHESIIKGQHRNVVLKKRSEPLDSLGQCDAHSKNCDIDVNAVELM